MKIDTSLRIDEEDFKQIVLNKLLKIEAQNEAMLNYIMSTLDPDKNSLHGLVRQQMHDSFLSLWADLIDKYHK